MMNYIISNKEKTLWCGLDVNNKAIWSSNRDSAFIFKKYVEAWRVARHEGGEANCAIECIEEVKHND